MKSLLSAARALLQDLASTILFYCVYTVSHNTTLAVALGLMLAVGQIGWHLLRGKSVDALQWISLVVVLSSGSTAIITNNPVFVMLQPSFTYLLLGWAMLKRGWMNRYLPPRALEFVSDLAVRFGYVWAGLMFFSAALNLVLAANLSVTQWGLAMTIWGTGSKFALFLFQYGVMKFIGRRRYHGQALAA